MNKKKTMCVALTASLAVAMFTGCGGKNPATETTNPVAEATLAVETTIHQHSYEEKVVPPTCKEKGYTEHKCSECGDTYKDSFTETVPHQFGDWETTKAATVNAEGEQQRSCSMCGEIETRNTPKLESADTSTNTQKPVSQNTQKPATPTEPKPAPTEPKPAPTEPEPVPTEPETEPAPTEQIEYVPVEGTPELIYTTNPFHWKIYSCLYYGVFVIDLRSWGGDDLSVSLVDNGVYFRYTNQNGEVIEQTVMSEQDNHIAVTAFIEEDGSISYDRNGDFC